MPPLRRILVIGSGGRENSLAWALKRSTGIEQAWVSPGNGGTQHLDGCSQLRISEDDFDGIIEACSSHQINLVVIGPEAPLAAGLADELREAGVPVFGPSAFGAQIEASKDWAKALMNEALIPTAQHWTVQTEVEALNILNQLQRPLVVKADGLASGKGVTVAETVDATATAIKEAFNGKFGKAGEKLLLEEQLQGPEVSVFALCDGKQFVVLPSAQDHKRLGEGDKGPNTGGMGAYAPAPILNSQEVDRVKKSILQPTIDVLRKKGIDYRGVIYAGLMLTSEGPKVIEFNCRFGDPECQTLMPLMGPELAHVLQACALGCLQDAPELSILSSCSACVVAAAEGYPSAPRKNDPLKIQLKTSSCLQLFHAGTSSNQEGVLVTSGGRVLAVVAQADGFDDAFRLAYRGLDQVQYKGMVFRRDIGHQVRKS